MTFHVRAVADVVRTVRASEACRRVRILVGGYPFNVDHDLWRRIGADGSAHDARGAVALANHLVDGSSRP
jgi:methanogenic corrinoid protein MtbC1